MTCKRGVSWCAGVVCGGLYLLSGTLLPARSWAQTTDSNADYSVTLTTDEETAIDPLYDGTFDSEADPDPASSDTPSDTDVDAPLPPPPPDWDLNDQGGYDPRLGDFTVYMGTIGGSRYKPFTHHGKYLQYAKNWFRILTARPAVTALLLACRAQAFEIRYWYDPIPGPLEFAAHLTTYTFDGAPLADVYVLNADQLDYRLDELEDLFGRPVFITPCRFPLQQLASVHKYGKHTARRSRTHRRDGHGRRDDRD